MRKKNTSVRIITGKSSEMKNIVNSIINEYGFLSEDDFFNSGVIIVNLV